MGGRTEFANSSQNQFTFLVVDANEDPHRGVVFRCCILITRVLTYTERTSRIANNSIAVKNLLISVLSRKRYFESFRNSAEKKQQYIVPVKLRDCKSLFGFENRLRSSLLNVA